MSASSANRKRTGARRRVNELQRARIIAAVSETLVAQGLEATRISRVLHQARIPRGVFYQQFHDRDECLAAALETAHARARQSVQQALAVEQPFREQARSVLYALLELFASEPVLGRLCLIQWGPGQPQLERMRLEAIAELARALRRGAHAKQGSGARIRSEALITGALGAIHAELTRPRPNLASLANPLMSVLMSPYLGREIAAQELRRGEPPTLRALARRRPNTGVNGNLRITYRTLAVLKAISDEPGLNNSRVGELAENKDAGQTSKLLKRLAALGVILNSGSGAREGQANSWWLTDSGQALQRKLGVPTTGAGGSR